MKALPVLPVQQIDHQVYYPNVTSFPQSWDVSLELTPCNILSTPTALQKADGTYNIHKSYYRHSHIPHRGKEKELKERETKQHG